MFYGFHHVLSRVATSVGFCEKPLKLIDSGKTSNFSCKLPCFMVFIKFTAKSFKKCVIF